MNHKIPSAAIFLTLALAAAAVAQTTVTINFTAVGVSRNAVVHVPSGATNAPVVFFVHGYGGSGASFENDTKGDVVSDREKFIAVYPSAVSGSWSMYDTADYPFLRALLDTVDARYKIDRSRVYCAGFSQGGFISFGVGYKHPEIFAAVAPVSGHIPSFSTSTPLKRPVPLFLTFGTNDISDVASFMTDVDTWQKLDSCSAGSKQELRPYPATNKNSVVARITYSCAQGSELMIDSVVGGTHEWAMDTQTKVNTTEEVWAFFKRFSLSGTTSLRSDALGKGTGSVSAVYRAGKVFLEGADDVHVAQAWNLAGGFVTTEAVSDHSFEFKGKAGGVYLVTVREANGIHSAKVTIP